MPKTRFTIECPGAETVFLAGDFNDWAPQGRRMKRVRKGEDVFVAVVDLQPGRHEFKYVVDRDWVGWPQSPHVPNDVGSENSVVEVS